MKRSLKKFFGTLLTSIALVGVLAGFAPAAKVSAATAAQINLKGSGIFHTNTAGFEIGIHEYWDDGLIYASSMITGNGETIGVYIHNLTTKKSTLLMTQSNVFGTKEVGCYINSVGIKEPNARSSGRYIVEFVEIKGNKSNSLRKLEFVVISRAALSYMYGIVPNGSISTIYSNALLLASRQKSAYTITKAYFNVNRFTYISDFLDALYTKILGRGADYRQKDPTGYKYWYDLIKDGKKTKTQVLEDFLWSYEFKARCEKLGFKWQ